MSRQEKAPSTGETNTNTVNTSTTKTSHSHSHSNHLQQQQFPRLTVPKGAVVSQSGDGTLLQIVDKNGNALDPAHVAEMGWARKQIFDKKKPQTIPSNLAIPVGLAQIGIGAAMAILGVLAIRYQSYLFYYGSGLWTGMVVGITGALCAMCTKSGLPKPKWFCGGERWQVHILLGVTMLALSASSLLAIFSTAGLLQTAKSMVGVDMVDKTVDDETLDRRRSAGNIINSLLLLCSMLEILLSFSTFGMAITVVCKSGYKPSLLSSTGSSGSENQASREMMASTTEYQARKDRLLRWLGHHPRRSGFPGLPQPRGTLRPYVIPAQSVHQPYVIPAMSQRPVFTLPPAYPTSIAIPHPGYQIIMQMPGPQPMPVVPLPMRGGRTTPAAGSHISSHHHQHQHHQHAGQLLLVPDDLRMKHHHSQHHHQHQHHHQQQQQQLQQQHQQQQQLHALLQHRSHNSSVSNLSVATRRSSKCSVASSGKVGSASRRICEEKNREVEITEEEVSKTYTGLDRSVAEDFIAQTMNDGTHLIHEHSSSDSTVSTEESAGAAGGDEEEELDEVERDHDIDEDEPEQEISRL